MEFKEIGLIRWIKKNSIISGPQSLYYISKLIYAFLIKLTDL